MPIGYSFNADGTAIYLSMAALFIAQAYGIDMTLSQQIGLLLLLLVTSKGSGSVAGSGFVVLAATLSATHVLPVEGLALLIGIDRFMSEARSVTNIIGNALAVVVVAKASGEFDPAVANTAYEEADQDDFAITLLLLGDQMIAALATGCSRRVGHLRSLHGKGLTAS